MVESWHISHLKDVESTNSYAKQLRRNKSIHHNTAIVSDFQTGGRGRGSNKWHSEPGENLLLSAYKKINIEVNRHFALNMAVSQAICEVLLDYGIKAKIKWPNDIYVGDNKIAGILIENSIYIDKISDSIIGIGMNINQNNFPESLPNPISMSGILKKDFLIQEIVIQLLESLDKNIDLIADKGLEIHHNYLKLLYRINEEHTFSDAKEKFSGRIKNVLPDGTLQILQDGTLRTYLFGEIEYII